MKPTTVRVELSTRKAHEFEQECSAVGIAKVREVVILADLLREDVVFGRIACEVLTNEN